jgi:hypothetical protein
MICLGDWQSSRFLCVCEGIVVDISCISKENTLTLWVEEITWCSTGLVPENRPPEISPDFGSKQSRTL